MAREYQMPTMGLLASDMLMEVCPQVLQILDPYRVGRLQEQEADAEQFRQHSRHVVEPIVERYEAHSLDGDDNLVKQAC